jgi:hypothetical protein
MKKLNIVFINVLITALFLPVANAALTPSTSKTFVATPTVSAPISKPLETSTPAKVATPIQTVAPIPTPVVAPKPSSTPNTTASVPTVVKPTSPATLPVKVILKPSIAIIDSGINASIFSNIATQVCALDTPSCSNGQSLMEGPNAADTGYTTDPVLVHGTEMASIINYVNKSINIIPIRIAPITAKGTGGSYTINAIKTALDWVVANYAKYNIVAVNVSQGSVLQICDVPAPLIADIDLLKSANVAVIAATGNNSNRLAMSAIACLSNVVSVGATDNPALLGGAAWDSNAAPTIGLYSNGNSATSFYTNGRWFAAIGNQNVEFCVGTSSATAAFSGWWVLNYKGTYADTYNWLASSSIPTSNSWLTGRYVKILQ